MPSSSATTPEHYGVTRVVGPDGGSVPVTLDGGSVTIDNVTVPASVTVNNTTAAPVPVSDAGGTISIDDGSGSITVDGPLTDTQLRATAVPVSGPLTDTQLRALPLPVSGTVTVSSPLAVSGSFLTDTQLRATAVPVSSKTPAATPTTTRVLGSTSSQQLTSLNSQRRGLMISNISSSKLYLSFDSTATIANAFIEMAPGAFLLLDQQLIMTNAIYGIWTSANGAAQITEFA